MIKVIKLTSLVLTTMMIVNTSLAAVVSCRDENNAEIQIAKTEALASDSRNAVYDVYRISLDQGLVGEHIGSNLLKDEVTRFSQNKESNEDAITENFLTFSIEGCGLYVEISKEQKSGFYIEDEKSVKLTSCEIK